jgi:alanine racemase
MTLRLRVDAERWRAHLRSVAAATHGLVPVAKGNGYGFGIPLLAGETAALGLDTLAIGTYAELDDVSDVDLSIVVLSPWRPFVTARLQDRRVIHTVSRVEDLAALASTPHRPRVLVEVLTSMHRHGIPAQRLRAVTGLLSGVDMVGWSVHLPLVGDTTGQARELADAARAVVDAPVWVSHVPAERLGEVAPQVRSRVGTGLWLGDRGALRVESTVLDVHPLPGGAPFGYRQRTVRRSGATLLVVSGGTAHGIALSAPSPATTARQRGVAVADGGLQALGRARSPFIVAGHHAWFAEPPHMHCSMLWLPRGAPVPAIGTTLPVQVRHTTTLVDEVVLR